MPRTVGNNSKSLRQGGAVFSFSLKRFALDLAYVIALVSLSLYAPCVYAQAVERNLPQVPKNALKAFVNPEIDSVEKDDTPIGPPLVSITLLGANDAVLKAPAAGVDVRRVARLAAVTANIEQALKPYLGRPISKQLIFEIKAKIVQQYRDLGFALVAVSTPEQEITQGSLQFRAVEFVVGEIHSKGLPNDAFSSLAFGEAIDVNALSDDLAWINRYPFAQTQVQFTPGAKLGTTNVILQQTKIKPWQLYAGVSNSGTEASGIERIYVGGSLGNILGKNSVMSYQATGSRDVFEGASDPNYLSHSFTYSLPVGRHKQIEASVNTVNTFQVGDPFSFGSKISESTIAYRIGIPPRYFGTGQTDLRLGLTAKQQQSTTFFGGTHVLEQKIEDYQFFVGLHKSSFIANGTSEFDIALHFSPGDIGGNNTDAAALAFSQGRVDKARYLYVNLSYRLDTRLSRGYRFNTQVTAQLSMSPLPRTEQSSLGGTYQVRGYGYDEGAFDTSLVLRNSFHSPVKMQNIDPFVFMDMGTGTDLYTRKSQNVASVGVGANISFARHATFHFDLAQSLLQSSATKSGEWKAHLNLNISF